jgi:hypothetical protein
VNHDGSTFACGCAPSLEAIFSAKSLDNLLDQGTENCSFFVMFRNDWYKYQFDGAWLAIAMATIKPPGKDRTVVAVSPGGAYFEVEPKSLKEVHGSIKAAENSLRSIAAIDDVIYACGMARSVLRRDGPGAWDEIGPGTTKDDDGLVVGFEDIAGFSKDDMYAVGWMGEIWRRRSGKWRRLDSPVSANLNAVCCATDGRVYVAGDDGVILRGGGDVWEALEIKGVGNLMDVAFYDKTVYVVTDFQILKLEDDALVPESAFADPDDFPTTCLHLLIAQDGLVSMGTKDLFRLRRGVWERLV